VYRFQLDGVWHVAVLGDAPHAELGGKLGELLACGEAVSLPPIVATALLGRRADATRHGPWVERHYRPNRGPREARY
jgi:hypothetical protein